MARLSLCIAWIFAALILQTGCGEPEGPPPQAKAILHKGNGAEPETLDPHLMTGVPEFNIAWSLFEGLTSLDPRNLDVLPAAAESWEVSDDGLFHRFVLRADARWSNGDPVTSADFLFGWRRILSPALGGSYASFLYCIEGARDYCEGATEDFSTVAVAAPDPRTLEVRLALPTPHFLFMLSLPFYFPVHEATILEFGDIDAIDTKWTRHGNLVSNGPFLLTEWRPEQILRVRPNPHYWDAAAVRLDGIDFHPIQSQQTEERAFRTGKLHVTGSLAPSKIAVYKRKNPEALHIDPYYGTYFYRFNTTKPPLDDARVRRALAMSINREEIVDYITRGGQEPAQSLVPPGVGYEPGGHIPFDVDAARALLAEAGYPKGQGLPAIEILYNTSEVHRSVAEAVQHMWKTNLGVDVQLVNQDWKVYLSTVENLDYEIARGSWIGDYVSPASFLDLFITGNAHNRCGYSDPEYDALLEEAMRTTDREPRYALYRRAEAILLEAAPIAPIYFYARIYLKVPQLKAYHPNLLGYPSYKGMYFEDAGKTSGG